MGLHFFSYLFARARCITLTYRSHLKIRSIFVCCERKKPLSCDRILQCLWRKLSARWRHRRSWSTCRPSTSGCPSGKACTSNSTIAGWWLGVSSWTIRIFWCILSPLNWCRSHIKLTDYWLCPYLRHVELRVTAFVFQSRAAGRRWLDGNERRTAPVLRLLVHRLGNRLRGAIRLNNVIISGSETIHWFMISNIAGVLCSLYLCIVHGEEACLLSSE